MAREDGAPVSAAILSAIQALFLVFFFFMDILYFKSTRLPTLHESNTYVYIRWNIPVNTCIYVGIYVRVYTLEYTWDNMYIRWNIRWMVVYSANSIMCQKKEKKCGA